jgi:hypothetical protein
MTKRQDILKYCRYHGLIAKPVRSIHGGTLGVTIGTIESVVRDGCEMAIWSDIFDGWNELYQFLADCNAAADRGIPYPWRAAR